MDKETESLLLKALIEESNKRKALAAKKKKSEKSPEVIMANGYCDELTSHKDKSKWRKRLENQ